MYFYAILTICRNFDSNHRTQMSCQRVHLLAGEQVPKDEIHVLRAGQDLSLVSYRNGYASDRITVPHQHLA